MWSGHQRLLGSGPVLLVAYFIANSLVIFTNPAKYVTKELEYVGPPVGDRSEEVRLVLANASGISSDVTWDLGNDACGFTWYWRIVEGAGGLFVNLQNYSLCERNWSIDYYALEGVDILSPNQGETCNDYEDLGHDDCDGCDSLIYKSCEDDVLRHFFWFDLDDYSSELGLPEGSEPRDIELLFSYTNLLGVYGIADSYFICDEPIGTSVSCSLQFVFRPEERAIDVESRTSTVDVRSAIFEEIANLARDPNLMPHHLTGVGMAEEICDAIAPSKNRVSCSISCNASYPYPSSTCTGKYVLKLVRDVRHWLATVLIMLAATVLCWVSMSTLRLGVRTSNGRTARGYLGSGGSCRYFFEEGNERQGDRLSLDNRLPPIVAVRVSRYTISVTNFGSSGSGLSEDRGGQAPAGLGNVLSGDVGKDDEAPACLGIVLCGDVREIAKEVVSSTTGRSVGSGWHKGSGALPICFIVRENSDGSVKNLDVEEAHRVLDGAGGRALLDESFGGDHLAWARNFSVTDAFGCVMTLWTVHFVAANSGWGSFYWVAALIAVGRWCEESDVTSLAGVLFFGVRTMPKNRHSAAPPLPFTLAVMEVLYDLSIPKVEFIGLVVTVIWTLLIVGSCGYFIFLLGYEPVYYGGGLFSSKVPLSTALSVGGALNCPFALAGDWVRGSRGGDMRGRLAVSFCVGVARADSDLATRVGRVHSISDLSVTLQTGTLCG